MRWENEGNAAQPYGAAYRVWERVGRKKRFIKKNCQSESETTLFLKNNKLKNEASFFLTERASRRELERRGKPKEESGKFTRATSAVLHKGLAEFLKVK